MPQPVVYFEIVGGEDAAAQHAFYAELFGWEVTPVESTGGSYATVRGAGIGGGVGAFQGGPSYVAVYVEADDPAAALERARALGAEVLMEPREVSPGVVAGMFRDPAGHMVGVMKGAPRA
jgi:predicted enzyme related to lactoylglutathione lyase